MKVFGELEKAQVELLTADPTGAELVVGRIWYRTDTEKLKMYDGTAIIVFDQRIDSKNLIGISDLDFEESTIFYKSIAVGENFSFTNDYDGAVVSFFVTNTSGATISVTFPGVVQWAGGVAVTDVPANQTNAYTFARVAGSIYASVVDGMA